MKTAIITALENANRAYIARKGENANLDKNGMQNDIASAIATVKGLTDETVAEMGKICNFDHCFKLVGESTNVKKALRVIDVLILLASDNLKYCRASAHTFVLSYSGILTADPKTREGLVFVCTGKGNENTSDQVKVTQARKLRDAVGSVALASVCTQMSVAWSKGGLADMLGAIVPGTGARGKKPEVNHQSPALAYLDRFFARLTDNKIAIIKAQKGEKK